MKWVAPIASVIVAALSAFAAPLQDLIAAHPSLAGILAAIGVLAGSLAPRPQEPKQ